MATNKELPGLLRTHHCGQLRTEDIGKEVTLCGWVNKYRNLGSLHFIDLRDKFGLTQLGFETFKGDITVLKKFSLESVILAKGKVRARPESAINNNMPTGGVEVQVEEVRLLSQAEIVPFLPHGVIESTEDLKLKYRYLDLRTTFLQSILKLRSDTARKIRTALYEANFTEVETPILYKTTPEGARDYIVPSRVHKGKVYALPQSPQTLKQLLMIGGTDKYFQLCKCFRDEDLRAERQPEFTQVDIEVSFARQEYIRNLATKLVQTVFNLPENFQMPMLTFDEVMRRYGSDKPDTRFGLEHMDVTALFAKSEFKVFSSAAQAGGLVKAIFVSEKTGSLARKDIDALTDVVKPYGGKGVAWFKVAGGEITGGIAKFITPEIHKSLQQLAGTTEEGTWFFSADNKAKITHDCMDAVRRHLGKQLKLIDDKAYNFLWVYDFPLLDYDDETKRFYALHHPFTSPKDDDMEKFMHGGIEELKKIKANAYDVVCNGYEIGGGSVRIFDTNVQQKMFNVLGMQPEECQMKFGFFLEALKYGTPPHAGIAFGFDRIMMLLARTENIRDVISFPKTNAATDLMAQAPSFPGQEQLDELSMRFLD
ncbi:MAG: aspartate--tRNA ligase [Bacteriovoracaceae bacterium]|nr:aspartate--tRNA ligase [Bacteriovoracaceae bacterium]